MKDPRHTFPRWLASFRYIVRARTDAAKTAAAHLRERADAWSLNATQRRGRWRDPILLGTKAWFATRPRRAILLGMPSMVAAIVALSGMMIVTGHRPRITRETELVRLAEVAMANRDYSRAAIAYQRLVQVGGADDRARFGLAQCWAALKDRRQAVQLLSSLAPDDSPGYLPAHRVRAYLLMESPDAPAAQLALARTHLERVLAAEPADIESHGMMGMILMRLGHIDAAREHFARAAIARPEMALNAALLSKRLGDAQAVPPFAQQAEAYFRARLRKADASTADAIGLAQALHVQGQYAEALDLVEDRMSSETNPLLAQAITEICAAWQEAVDQSSAPADMDRLTIARAMLDLTPSDRAWQVRLLQLTHGTSAVRAPATAVVESLEARGHAGPEICFHLGMEAWKHDNLPRARQLLEKSFSLQPHAPTANNLACLLLLGPQADLPLALAYCNRALTLDPANPNYRETRGEVLVSLERWREAADDFEAALPRLQSRRNAHLQLSRCYEHLGNHERSREHLRHAAQEAPSP